MVNHRSCIHQFGPAHRRRQWAPAVTGVLLGGLFLVIPPPLSVPAAPVTLSGVASADFPAGTDSGHPPQSPALPSSPPSSHPSSPQDSPSALPFMDDTTFRQHYWPFAADDARRPDMVLAVSGDYRGQLSPCGCRHLRMGGLPWRMDFTGRLQQASGQSVVQLDTGGTLVHPGLPPEMSVVYLEYMLSALGRAGWTALNVTPSEALALDLFWQLPSAPSPTGSSAGSSAGSRTGQDGARNDTRAEMSPVDIWRQWLPRTFHLLGDPPSLLAGLWDIRQIPPPLPGTLATFRSGSAPASASEASASEASASEASASEASASEASASEPVTLLSANLRHPHLPTHHVLRTPGGDYFITGLTLFPPESELPSLPAPWEVCRPEDGWSRFVREVLPEPGRSGSDRSRPARGPVRGVVVLLWGDGDAAARLATRIRKDLAARGDGLSPLLFYSSGPQGGASPGLASESLPLIPVGVEGRFLALARPLDSGFHVQSVTITGQFRPPDTAAAPSDRPAGTAWDRVMEVAFYLHSHLTLRSLEMRSLKNPSGSGANGSGADGSGADGPGADRPASAAGPATGAGGVKPAATPPAATPRAPSPRKRFRQPASRSTP